ncbi:ATP-dependent DNA ligase, partial [Mycobacterium sp. E740]|uniref:ATP-dependent DNA ligase n=1 Tax=Mycobacterium sp. E740 TaxID=1834149 RepID=UPI0007FE53DD
RYFPEVIESVRDELAARCVLDGEIVVPREIDGRTRLDWESLSQRIHPAESRIKMLSAQTPAHFIGFDALATGDTSLMKEPFRVRRDALLGAVTEKQWCHVTRTTEDPELGARWLEQFEGAGLDGIVAKPSHITYQPDKRVMFKIKHERTADCVVAGYRVHKSGEDAIGSLLLGLYKPDGTLASVGVIGAFPMARRRELFAELQSLRTTFDEHPWNWAAHTAGGNQAGAGDRTPRRNEGSRWNAGKDLTFVPLRPERVVEVRYDHMEGERFRHTAQFNRWRPDRDPRSCTYEQLEQPVTFKLADIMPGL